MQGNWVFPTSIRFGAGRVAEVPEAAAELGIRRPLLVTDPGLATLPPAEQTRGVLRDAGLGEHEFHDVAANPTGANVSAGVAAYREAGCDGVVALGGGAALDVGKAIALMVGQTRALWDFEDVGDNWRRVDPDGVAPVVAVPTTSGTGSEVGRASVIADTDARVKRIVFHPSMLPGRVVCDPALTVGLPPHLTAVTGMDALSHNLEAWCAPGFHPLADGIAVQGMALVRSSLLRAHADGTDLDARARMMAASLMGATAFQKGLGAMHALAHPLGALFDLHHGTAIAVVMPYVLRAHSSVIGDRLAELARLLGLPGEGPGAVVDWVIALRAALRIPHTLAELGVPLEAVSTVAKAAAADPSCGTNPSPLDTDALGALMERAVTGTA